MHRLAIAFTALTLVIALILFAYFWFWIPQRIFQATGNAPSFDNYDMAIAVTTIVLSLGLGFANFLYSRGEHKIAITPSIYTKLVFRPVRGYVDVPIYTNNQLWVEVTNLHSVISPMNMQFKTSFRTVRSGSNGLNLRSLPLASEWKPSFQRLEYLRPNEQRLLEVLINAEATIEPLSPKLFEVIRNGQFATYEVLPVPVYVEVRIECEYSLSIPGTGRQQIETVHYYCSPSGENPIHWGVYTDHKRRMSIATRSEGVRDNG